MNRIRVLSLCDRIDIGCGPKCKEGFTGIDIVDHGQDILWDITHGIPLPNDSVSEIYSSHCVEHLPEHAIQVLMLELIRICRNGATIEIRCPHSRTDEAYFVGHLTRWDERRVRGIVQGINGLELGKKLMITSLEHVGIELRFELLVQ